LNDGDGGNPYGIEIRRDPLAGASGSYTYRNHASSPD
jgi:hypothetical protein